MSTSSPNQPDGANRRQSLGFRKPVGDAGVRGFTAAVAHRQVGHMKVAAFATRFWKTYTLWAVLMVAIATAGCQTCDRYSVSEERELAKYGLTKKPPEEESHFNLFQLAGDVLTAVFQ